MPTPMKSINLPGSETEHFPFQMNPFIVAPDMLGGLPLLPFRFLPSTSKSI